MTTKSPSYAFRIEEIAEHPNIRPRSDHGDWKPPIDAGWNYSLQIGVSNMFGHCNGQQIGWLTQQPAGSQVYKKYSMYYADGLGFWVLRGDARSPQNGDDWHRLCFDSYDANRCTSYLTNAGQLSTLRVQPPYPQAWATMLLPDIYHSRNPATPHHPGGLVGELPIFLGLMAFTITRDNLASVLPHTFAGGRWNVHAWQAPRTHKRGIVVTVYSLGTIGSTPRDLYNYELGTNGVSFF